MALSKPDLVFILLTALVSIAIEENKKINLNKISKSH